MITRRLFMAVTLILAGQFVSARPNPPLLFGDAALMLDEGGFMLIAESNVSIGLEIS